MLDERTSEEAEEFFAHFRPKLVKLDEDTMKATSQFRMKHKLGLSYIDACAYIYAIRRKM